MFAADALFDEDADELLDLFLVENYPVLLHRFAQHLPQIGAVQTPGVGIVEEGYQEEYLLQRRRLLSQEKASKRPTHFCLVALAEEMEQNEVNVVGTDDVIVPSLGEKAEDSLHEPCLFRGQDRLQDRKRHAEILVLLL